MASMASLFTSLLPQNPHKTHFAAPIKTSLSLHSNPTRGRIQICCGLIEPDGGKLVDLVVKDAERSEERR